MQKHQFKILSIDGGGIRGIIPCMILKEIQKQLDNEPLADYFDLFAGTSTGGIIALGLNTMKPLAEDENEALPYTAAELLELYVNEGDTIFKLRKKVNLIDFKSKLLNSVKKGLGDRPYDEAFIEELLERKFRKVKLSDSIKEVIITSYDIKKAKPRYFQSRLAKEEAKNNTSSQIDNEFVKVIARSTSAAPTFFNPSVIDNAVLIDGGVFANNPSILAYGEAKEIWYNLSDNQKGYEPMISPKDEDLPFFMLSIGTGKSAKSISVDEVKDKTAKAWIQPLLKNIFMDSVAESTHFTMQHLLPKYKNGDVRYIRLEVSLDRYKGLFKNITEMDIASEENIKALQAIAEAFVFENGEKIKAIAKLISKKPLTDAEKALIA